MTRSLAAVLSAAHLALGLFWTFGGAGFPFSATDDAIHAGAVLVGLGVLPAAPLIACLGALGTVAAVALPRAVAWSLCVLTIVVVPDARVLVAVVNVPMFNLDPLNAAVLYQLFAMVTAWALGRSAAARGGPAPEPGRAAWERYAMPLAIAAPLVYTVTRWAWAAGIHLGVSGEFLRSGGYDSPGARLAEFVLGAMAAAGALLTLGLRQRWGTVFPRWLPGLAGRRVPPSLAVVPATAVAGVLTAAGLSVNRGFVAMHLGWTPREPVAAPENWGAWVPPLLWLLWGLALGAATLSYRRRRAAAL
ncbi:hypothetical protein [Spirillospora sp. CA-294931]|uniref:hypothetical protein n=1 Tax=Spirillospora sp. CA-294931 TaxID=3240042 RepID=UPI003D918E25